MEMNGQLHAMAVLPPGKSGRCLLNRRLKSTEELEVPVTAVGKSDLQHVAVNYVTAAFKPFKRRVKSHLPSAGIIRSSPYSPR